MSAEERGRATGLAEGSLNSVHRECGNRREWLLKCIRYSGKAAEYVAAREKEEAPRRALRAAPIRPSQQAQPIDTGEMERRIMESLLKRLLGGGAS
jgi:hypothetical protein